MSKKTLYQLYAEHTGKVSDKWSLYLTEYDRLFDSYRAEPVRLLEIGIQNGGSLEIWSKYFSNAAALIGCDIDPECARLSFDDPRISVVVGDANAPDVRERVFQRSPQFDLIIDDGSHLSSDIIRSFALYFPRLVEGGIFIAEDLHCSYWSQFEGGLFDPFASISFFKRLADVINHEHWGIPKARADILRGFSEKFGCELDAEALSQVHSVEFINSMCVVRKASVSHNGLGLRVIVGSLELVVSGLQSKAHEPDPVLDQSSNPWTSRETPPDEAIQHAELAIVSAGWQIASLTQTVAERDGQIVSLTQTVAERDGQIVSLTQTVAERDGQIVSLNRTAANSDVQIANFNRLRFDRDKQIANLRHVVAERDNHIITLNQVVVQYEVAKRRIDELLASSSWRITAPIRYISSKVRRIVTPLKSIARIIRLEGGLQGAVKKSQRIFLEEGLSGLALRILSISMDRADQTAMKIRPDLFLAAVDRNDYKEWVNRYDLVSGDTRSHMRLRIKTFSSMPLISVIIPTYNSTSKWLVEAIESVRKQIYPNWELCIADDASTDNVICHILERYAQEDSRIKVTFREENGHISAASNTALNMVTGEWVALLDHDDMLAETAFFWVAEAINENPKVKLIYSDEDKIDENGLRSNPYFKCDWNLDLFYSHNLVTHLGIYRADMLREIGGFTIGLEGAQDYDLALRCIEKIDAQQIFHIPRVLYHWRMHAQSTSQSLDAKPYAGPAGERALNDHFQRKKISASVTSVDCGYRVHYTLLDNHPMVSLIIPTRNGLELLRQCVSSILLKTTYLNYEIIIVDNGSDDPAALQYLTELQSEPNIRVVRDDRPFNYSALNNAAVKLASGELVGLLNNDLEVISPNWLSEMVSIAIQPNVGAVGARLLYPDKTLQHAGVVLGLGGVAGHAHKYLPHTAHGYSGRASSIQSFSAVTGACLLIRRSIYLDVEGLDEGNLSVAFNDIDFCLRVREAGYRNVWTPYAELYHHESATRGFEDTPEKQARFSKEVIYMKQRWGDKLLSDPAYSPNLTVSFEDFSFAWPPRVAPILSSEKSRKTEPNRAVKP